MKEENNMMYSRFRQIGEGSVRFTCTREEMFDFIKSEIRLAEQSLVGRVKDRINKAMNKLPSDMTMMQSGSYITLQSMLDWEELSANKNK